MLATEINPTSSLGRFKGGITREYWFHQDAQKRGRLSGHPDKEAPQVVEAATWYLKLLGFEPCLGREVGPRTFSRSFRYNQNFLQAGLCSLVWDMWQIVQKAQNGFIKEDGLNYTGIQKMI